MLGRLPETTPPPPPPPPPPPRPGAREESAAPRRVGTEEVEEAELNRHRKRAGMARGRCVTSSEDDADAAAPENGETGVAFPFHFGVDGIEGILHRRPRRLGLFDLSLVLGVSTLQGSNCGGLVTMVLVRHGSHPYSNIWCMVGCFSSPCLDIEIVKCIILGSINFDMS
ncbi:hypothetical protein PAHAL_7G300700 [Panicum hallii]|uniref:Uncharacterized protein n=1 Tax=Panicum hallii TaxID=206008 RepID=A0A2T8IDY4_9POAL|nr:hypothetical protein PAHAL_7G300700 [Panicum hallii]